MNVLDFLTSLDAVLTLPTLFLFFCAGLYLTYVTGFVQLYNFRRFIHLLTRKQVVHDVGNQKSVHPVQAMVAAMATTIGMGNIVGPSVAIMIGGPGALFWLMAYSFFGSVLKFCEVTFSVTFRKQLPDGTLLAGPTQYLREVTPLLGTLYAACTVFLFAGWSGLQANTFASIFALEGVPTWMTGLMLAVVVFTVIIGGIQRVSSIASRAVPLMFLLYFIGVATILFQHADIIMTTLWTMVTHAFSPAAAVGGFAGASMIVAIKNGVQRNMYITEAGLGTSSIAHGMTDVASARNQAILAMYSIIADTFVSFCSGLVVLVTGTWMTGCINNTVMYELFKKSMPHWCLPLEMICIILFVLTTVIGNSFNAMQSYFYFARTRGKVFFALFLALVIFLGSQMHVPLIWKLMDVIMVIVGILHLVGLLLLSKKRVDLLR